VRCGSCATENEAGRKFCGSCGARLLTVCPSCGTGNTPGVRFCGECGSSLEVSAPVAGAPAGTGPAAAAPGSHAAERRLVSVLFADLVGFTTLAQDRDPEETRELLTRYFDLSRDVVDRYGGVVEKFIGDAVMAVWGAPTAREDDAERAVRAALELVDAVRTLGEAIDARAGVITGEAAVTIGAVGQGMVAGDLVNTASRLQSVAAPGTVLVGESTQRAAAAAIAFEEAGEQLLKGKTAPVPAWRALRVVAERGGRGRADTLEAPFVGRDDELRLLKDLFHATGREKRARLVSITGQGGIGKSRLAWEFLKYIDGLIDDVFWHEGRSPAYGDGITFWALGEMVRRRAQLAETDDETTTRERIAATLAEYVPDADERRWIEPRLLALLGIGDTPVGAREELFAAWRTFFERVAARGTVALVFEDLQWADAGLLDFIDHVLEWSKGAPIYIVTLARPELLERRPEWGAGRRNFVAISLEPLPEPAMRDLLAGLVPGLPEAALLTIVERADGVPLYAVETVRMLVADGRLSVVDGAYQPTGDLTSLAVPETLQALIAARLDALEPGDRTLLQDASVLGQSFAVSALAAVSGADAEGLEPRLRALVRRELLHLDADPRSPERGQYTFVQGLIREVAYGTLAKRDRRSRHLAAARYFEGIGEDELAGALAAHYLAAYRAAPEGAEGEAVAAQARLALRGAAERAAALGSNDQAVTFLEQALTVTIDPVEEADLLERAGSAASYSGRYEEADQLYLRAITLRRTAADRPATMRAVTAAAQARLVSFAITEALELLEPAAAEFADLAGTPDHVALAAQVARAYYLHEELPRAIQAADAALEQAERLDLAGIVSDLLVTRGSALAVMGRTHEGMALLRAGCDLADALGQLLTGLRARVNLSSMFISLDPRTGFAVANEGIEMSRRAGNRGFTVTLVASAIETALHIGEWPWADAESLQVLTMDLEPVDRSEALQNAVVMAAVSGRPIADLADELDRITSAETDALIISETERARAWAALAQGRLDDAWAAARKGARHSALNAPNSLNLAGRAALWAHDADRAREALAGVVATGQHGPAVLIGRTAIEAGISGLEGRRAEATAGFRAAAKAARDLGVVFDLALIGIDAALTLPPDDPDVRPLIDEAREILLRLGARPFLERLDKAVDSQAARAPSASAVSAIAEPATTA
jgi:class 3 adenylate cyclase/tetratricopeptide (TPR) repeat protein